MEYVHVVAQRSRYPTAGVVRSAEIVRSADFENEQDPVIFVEPLR